MRRAIHQSIFLTALVAGLTTGDVSFAQQATAPDVVELFEDQGETFVRAGSKDGLTVGMSIAIVGKPIGDTTERRKVGSAAVLEVYDTIARVSLDKAAKAATGEKHAKIPAKSAGPKNPPPASATKTPPASTPLPPPPPPPTVPKAAGGTLAGDAAIAFPSRLRVSNKSAVDWTDCRLTLDDGRYFQGFHVRPWADDTVRLGAFTPSSDNPPKTVDVVCAQGSGKFKVAQ